MPSKKKTLPTPLHLLKELSDGLVVHLEKACAKALSEAQAGLTRLEIERGKVQEMLQKQHTKLQEAKSLGKTKIETHAKQGMQEAQELLESLKGHQTQVLQYISDLKKDTQESLKLAEGINKVRDAAAKALNLRSSKKTPVKASSTPKKSVAKPSVTPPITKPSKKTALNAKPASQTSS